MDGTGYRKREVSRWSLERRRRKLGPQEHSSGHPTRGRFPTGTPPDTAMREGSAGHIETRASDTETFACQNPCFVRGGGDPRPYQGNSAPV